MTQTNEQKADSIFIDAYNGYNNIMTPTILKRGKLVKHLNKTYFYELSTGHKVYDSFRLYGVTVLSLSNSMEYCTDAITKEHDLCKAFTNEDEALGYIEVLKKAIKRGVYNE